MIATRFGQAAEIGTEENPIRITPSGVIPSVPSDFDTSSGEVIDLAPTEAQETPPPIHLPPLVVTPPKAPAIQASGKGLTTTQIWWIVGAGAVVASVIAYGAITSSGAAHRGASSRGGASIPGRRRARFA